MLSLTLLGLQLGAGAVERFAQHAIPPVVVELFALGLNPHFATLDGLGVSARGVRRVCPQGVVEVG